MKFYIVDVFAENKCEGNQLAVFMPEKELSTIEMQQIAREINFAESSFILSQKQENSGYNVKIFTPDTEVPFAGHPTLGTAYIIHKLIEKERYNHVYINLQVGTIPVSIENNKLTMEQKEPSFSMIADNKSLLANLLNIPLEDISSEYPSQVVSTGLPCLVIPLNTPDAVKRCTINHTYFQYFIENIYDCNILVFAPDTEYDLRVRVFANDTGFPEDAATGSANGNLAGYLLKYNYFNKSVINYTVGQGIEINRPSLLHIQAEMNDRTYKIKVGGKVQLVAKGEWI